MEEQVHSSEEAPSSSNGEQDMDLDDQSLDDEAQEQVETVSQADLDDESLGEDMQAQQQIAPLIADPLPDTSTTKMIQPSLIAQQEGAIASKLDQDQMIIPPFKGAKKVATATHQPHTPTSEHSQAVVLSRYQLPISQWPAYRRFYEQERNKAGPPTLEPFPSTHMPFHDQLKEWVLRWATWAVDIKTEPNRTQVLAFVKQELARAWTLSVEALKKRDVSALIGTTAADVENRRKKRKVEPEEGWLFSDGLSISFDPKKKYKPKTKVSRVLKSEMSAVGVTPEMVQKRLQSGDIDGVEEMVDKMGIVLGSEIEANHWWRGTQNPRDLFMYALHEVQAGRAEKAMLERLRRSFTKDAQRQNTLIRINEARARQEQYMALALEIFEAQEDDPDFIGHKLDFDIDECPEFEDEEIEVQQTKRAPSRRRAARVAKETFDTIDLSSDTSPEPTVEAQTQPISDVNVPDSMPEADDEGVIQASASDGGENIEQDLPPAKPVELTSQGKDLQAVENNTQSSFLQGIAAAALVPVEQGAEDRDEFSSEDYRSALEAPSEKSDAESVPTPHQHAEVSPAGAKPESKITLKFRNSDNIGFDPKDNDTSLRHYKGFQYRFTPTSTVHEREHMHDEVREFVDLNKPIKSREHPYVEFFSGAASGENGNTASWWRSVSGLVAHGAWEKLVKDAQDVYASAELYRRQLFLADRYEYDDDGNVLWLDEGSQEDNDDSETEAEDTITAVKPSQKRTTGIKTPAKSNKKVVKREANSPAKTTRAASKTLHAKRIKGTKRTAAASPSQGPKSEMVGSKRKRNKINYGESDEEWTPGAG